MPMKALRNLLARLGHKLFPFRLLVGLGMALSALEWICPTPLFERPYRAAQSLALLVILMGLSLREWSAGSAGHHTRSGRIEAPQLITGGAVAYLRNPIYAGSICIGVGMSLLIGDPKAFLVAGLAFVFLYFAIVPAEEDYLQTQFGADYLRYREAVPRFIPRLKPWQGRTETAFQWRAVYGEFGMLMLLVAIYV